MKYIFLIFAAILLVTLKTPAQTSAVEAVPAVVEVPVPPVDNSGTRRAANKYFALLNYSLLDLMVPSKYGATVGVILDSNRTLEFEYLHGGLSTPFGIADIGSMQDTRYSLTGRHYFGFPAFNVSYGLGYYDFGIDLGNDILNRVSAGSVHNIDLIKVKAVGVHAGIGHRWVFKHDISFGIDWFSWSQPLQVTERESRILDYASNKNDRDRVTKAIDWIAHVPRISVFKIQFGMLF